MDFTREDLSLLSRFPSRKEAVFQVLNKAIASGRFPAGMKLNQDKIADELGVSRMPVREALRDLESQGLVTVYPYRGVKVSELSIADIEELFAIRTSLERCAIARSVRQLTEQELTRMREVLLEMDGLVSREDSEAQDAWMRLNDEFHGVINRASGWPRIVEMIEALRSNVGRYLTVYLSIHGKTEPQKQHWELYRACVEGNVEQAADVIEKHVMDTAEILITALKNRSQKSRDGSFPIRRYPRGAKPDENGRREIPGISNRTRM